MGEVSIVPVAAEEAETRLDRWFKRHYPALGHGALEKLLRTGQIRVDGRRAKAGTRLAPGNEIRIPPVATRAAQAEGGAGHSPSKLDPADARAVRAMVLLRDRQIIALNKPAGLPVQGGSKVSHHLDAMLDGLRDGARERPRLVHRLDRDTSGVLVLARTAPAARALAAAFRERRVRKLYWALVAGRPRPATGEIDAALAKRRVGDGERVVSVGKDGQAAKTAYAVVDAAAKRVTWLALMPLTGRTHQLRAHCAEVLGHPILGDKKYGDDRAERLGLAPRLHLHARALALPGRPPIVAPLPAHMQASWRQLGFAEDPPGDPFAPFAP